MEKRRGARGRQLMVGIALVGVLLVIFSALLARRLMSSSIDAPFDTASAPPAVLIPPEAPPVAPDPATLDPATRGPVGEAPPGAVDPRDESRNPFRRRAGVATAAYESADDQAPASGRRRPLMRGQDGAATDAGSAPAVAPAPDGTNAPPSADPNAAPAAVIQAPDPTNQPPAAAFSGVPNAAANSQPPNGAAPFGAAAPPSANAPVDGAAPAGSAVAGGDPGPNDNATPAAAPAFIDQSAVQAAGRELPSGDGRFAGRDRFRDPGSRGDDPGVATAAAPGAYNAPAYSGQPAYGGQPGAFDSTAAAPPGEPGKYVVQPNDNYWTISEKVYGGGAFFKALERFNEGDRSQGHRLQVGDVVQTPPTSVLRQKWPDLCPKPRREQVASQIQPVTAAARQRMGAPIYIVEQGDSLFDIARHRLGKASRWVEIYDLNSDVLGDDFDYLKPGTELVMPSDRRQTQDTITRQPANNVQR